MKSLLQNILPSLEGVGQTLFANELRATWESLSTKEMEQLSTQVQQIDSTTLHAQQALLTQQATAKPSVFEPLEEVAQEEDIAVNTILLQDAACLLVAGGQGSRFGFDGPKGCYPISPEEGKSLFQLYAERTLAASAQVGKALPLAIMTSPLNHEATVDFFKTHNNFGLAKEQLRIFPQSMLPFLDEKGNLFCDTVGHLAVGPNGNGDALCSLVTSGIAKKWEERGVRYVTFVQVDNALGNPFCPILLSHHAAGNYDATVRCVERINPKEAVGLLLRQNGEVRVVEYSEIEEELRYAKGEDGRLLYPLANISNFCFSLKFIQQTAQEQWPLHLAHKKIGRIGDSEYKAWKFERFIFDCLPFAKKVGAILSPREKCFAPLKQAKGADGPEAVRAALLALQR